MILIRFPSIHALAFFLTIGATSAFGGAEPASPTPIVPPPPPASLTSAVPVALTPAQVQVAQALTQVFLNDPPTSISLNLQVRVVNLLQLLSAAPEILAQLGFTQETIQALIAQVRAIPTIG